MKMKAKVAVVTRTKNRPALLRRAIESVLNQVYPDWIHVIVNDGGSLEPVNYLSDYYSDRYKGRLHVIHNSSSVGMEASSNIGIRSCESELIAIHDDDDSWTPDFLRVMCASLMKQKLLFPSVRGAISFTNLVEEHILGGAVYIDSLKPYPSAAITETQFVALDSLVKKNLFPPISFLFERSAAIEAGLFDEDLPLLGDWDFNVRFAQFADIWIVPRYLAYYHQRISGDLALQNTVTADLHKHKLISQFLKNKWLRKDLENGNFGIGTLCALLSNTGSSADIQAPNEELCALLSISGSHAGIQTLDDALNNSRHQAELLSQLRERGETLQKALHDTSLTIENLQKQMDVIYAWLEKKNI